MTLRRRILALATGLTALVLVLFAVPLAIALRQSSTDRVIRQAEYVTQGVADFLSTGGYTSDQSARFVDRVNRRGDTAVTVVLPDGSTVGAGLPQGLPPAPGSVGPRGDGDRDRDDLGAVSSPGVSRVADGWLVDIRASGSKGQALVRGFVDQDEVRHEVYERWAWIAGGAIALMALSVIGAEVVSRRLTRPLVATASVAGRLSSGQMRARAPVDGAVEIAQVSGALNELADRIEDMLASERETMVDLSHRLRTPMTALRLDVEALPESERSLELARHVSILERTLTEVIERAGTPRDPRAGGGCDARDVVLERVGFWTPLAEDQGRQVDTDITGETVHVGCTADALAAAVDALIENVIAHTPEGSPLAVILVAACEGGVLDVTDRGEGIPQGSTRRGQSDRGSSGLGLDIARSCAEATGGRLEILDHDDGRHTVRLVLQGTLSRT